MNKNKYVLLASKVLLDAMSGDQLDWGVMLATMLAASVCCNEALARRYS